MSSAGLADTAVPHPASHNISRTAFLLLAFILLQKLLALGQQVLIGRVAGLSAETDAFYIAQTVPLLVGAWIMLSLTNTLIPMLRSGDPRRAAGVLVNIVGMLALSGLVLLIFADAVIRLLGHGLAPATAVTAVRLLREMAILVSLMGVSGILNALYYRRSRFLVPSVAGCLLYVGAIVGVLLKPWMGIDGFAWGLVAGGVAQVAMLWWFVGPQNFGRPVYEWGQLAIFGRSFVSILVASAVSILCVIVDRAFASSGPAGTVTGVTIASSLMTIPSAMVVVSLNSALLPAFVHLREDKQAFAGMVRDSLAYITFFLGPANLILFFGSEPLIRLMFHSNRFGTDSVLLTGGLLTAYSFGIFGMAFKDLFSNALIALGAEWMAMAGGMLSLGASIALKALYLRSDHPNWIASSTSIAMWIGAAFLIVALSLQVPVGWRRLWKKNGWRLALASGLFAACCIALLPYLRSNSVLLPLAVLSGAAVVYLAAAWMLRLNISTLQVQANLQTPPRVPLVE